MKISDCVALVTGGASGIGRGLCEALLQRHAKVAIVDLNEERGKEVERKFSESYGAESTKFIRCDVSIEKELREAFFRIISLWGKLDIVCNNAAVLDEVHDWNKTLNTNLGGVIHGTLLGLELMKSGSVIVNTSSPAGLSAWKLTPVYCATKHGIVAFTRSISNVYFLDKNKAIGEETHCSFNNQYGEGQAEFVCCDVTAQDQLEAAFKAMVKEHGRLDILVNNAGILEEKDWEKTLNVNLNALIRGTFLGIELMENGVIINVSSIGGLQPVSFCPVYCASKFGVIGFTRSIAPTALRKKGIRINCVCPGNTDTDIFKAMENIELTKKQQEFAANTPKQRPEAVAQCIVDLIKDETDVGQVVRVTYDEGVEYLNYNDIVI